MEDDESRASTQSGMTTRGRAAQSGPPASAAANLRLVTRSTRSTAASQISQMSLKKVVKQNLDESQQKASVKALFECRCKLASLETRFRGELESEGFQDISDHDLCERYAKIKSLRMLTDSICASMGDETVSAEQIGTLRRIIEFTNNHS